MNEGGRSQSSEREGWSRGEQEGRGVDGRKPLAADGKREKGSALTLSPPGATESGAGPVRGVLATVADRRRAILSCILRGGCDGERGIECDDGDDGGR